VSVNHKLERRFRRPIIDR